MKLILDKKVPAELYEARMGQREFQRVKQQLVANARYRPSTDEVILYRRG